MSKKKKVKQGYGAKQGGARDEPDGLAEKPCGAMRAWHLWGEAPENF